MIFVVALCIPIENVGGKKKLPGPSMTPSRFCLGRTMRAMMDEGIIAVGMSVGSETFVRAVQRDMYTALAGQICVHHPRVPAMESC